MQRASAVAPLASPPGLPKAPPPELPSNNATAPLTSPSGVSHPKFPAPTLPKAPPPEAPKADLVDLTEPSPWLTAWAAQTAPKTGDLPTPLFGRLRSLPLQSPPPPVQPKDNPWTGMAERRDESAGREASKLQPGFAPSGRPFYPSPQHTETIPPSPAVFSQVGNRTAGPHVAHVQFRVPATDPHSWLSPTQIQETPQQCTTRIP